MDAQKDIALQKYQVARNKLEKLYDKVRLKNEKGEILFWLGFSYIKEKSYLQSQKCLIGADKIYRTGALKGLIKTRLISVYLAQNNLTAAEQCYDEMLIGQYAELAEAEFNLGNFYTKRGKLKQASIFYQKCYKRNDLYFSPKAKPLVTKIGDGDFHLQVGLFSNYENVKEIVNKLKNQYNLDPSIVRILKNGRSLYRIQVGHFVSNLAAEKRKLQLKRLHPELELIVKP